MTEIYVTTEYGELYNWRKDTLWFEPRSSVLIEDIAYQLCEWATEYQRTVYSRLAGISIRVSPLDYFRHVVADYQREWRLMPSADDVERNVHLMWISHHLHELPKVIESQPALLQWISRLTTLNEHTKVWTGRLGLARQLSVVWHQACARFPPDRNLWWRAEAPALFEYILGDVYHLLVKEALPDRGLIPFIEQYLRLTTVKPAAFTRRRRKLY